MHGVFEPPQARTGRVHLDVEAVGIGNFVDAIPWFEGPDLNIAKRHGSTPLKGLGPAPITALEANGPSSKTHSKKTGNYGLFDGPFRGDGKRGGLGKGVAIRVS